MGEENAVHAGGGGGSYHGAQVARVLHVVENQQQGLVASGDQHLFLLRQGQRFGQRHHPLVGLPTGSAIQGLPRLQAHGNTTLPCCFPDPVQSSPATTALHQDAVQRTIPGRQRLEDRVDSDNGFH